MPEIDCGFTDIVGGAKGSDLLVNYGPTLKVDIGFDKNWNSANPINVPNPGIKNVEALVDTGATESCIDDMLAVQLNLPIINEQEIAGVGGQLKAKIYLAQIYVPTLDKTIYGAFAGVHLAAGGQMHKALIGRTFLKAFVMIYNGETGSVIIK
jgi:predicted aspartyl protease